MNTFEYILHEYALPIAKFVLMVIGGICTLAIISDIFSSPVPSCRVQNNMNFPIDTKCTVEFNVDGQNFGWTLEPYRENAKKVK